MTAPQLAKVGDVIQHGQQIPANVVQFTDKENDTWTRTATSPAMWVFAYDDGHSTQYSADEIQQRAHWWPLTVVEVDPEQREADEHFLMKALGVDRLDNVMPAIERFQADRVVLAQVMAELGVDQAVDVLPALEKRFDAIVLARKSRDEMRNRLEAISGELRNAGYEVPVAYDPGAIVAPIIRANPRSAPGPLVLTLPQVPEGASLRGGKSGDLYAPADLVDGEPGWASLNRGPISLARLLRVEKSVTVEFAPPREPRTWPKLDAIDPGVTRVDVSGKGPWERTRLAWVWRHLGTGQTWSEWSIRELGEVHEVIEP